MKYKAKAVVKSVLWGIVIIIFPVASGVLSAVLKFDTIKTLIFQGCFMFASLIPVFIFCAVKKRKPQEIGFGKIDAAGVKKALYFIPAVFIFIPVAVKGFYIKSEEYVLATLFLYAGVGISEEIYFRGLIPDYLEKAFTTKYVVIISALIFGLGHLSSAFGGGGAAETALNVLNAFIFGWMAIELAVLSKNIAPLIVIHFLFDLETKTAVIGGKSLIIAETVRGAVMFLYAIYLACALYKNRKKSDAAVEN
jgi:membrane protease YdiL (CAAX protease family)